jgi:uncharacterized protein (TIGR02246 family)
MSAKRWVAMACISLGVTWVATPAMADRQQDEAAIKALNDTFAAGFVAKDPVKRASVWADDGTLVPPNAGLLQGRAAIEKHFTMEVPSVTAKSTADFSNYRFDFLTATLAFVDADLTIANILGPDKKLHRMIPVKVVFLAERRGDKWWIRDERAYFPPPPPKPKKN